MKLFDNNAELRSKSLEKARYMWNFASVLILIA